MNRTTVCPRINRLVGLLGFLIGFPIAGHPVWSQNGDSPPDRTLRVLTYNIHHGLGVDGKLDLQRIADVIRSTSPDIVALQEVDQKSKRSNQIDQPERLGQLTEMQVIFGGNIPLSGGRYGNAVLTKLPILSDRNDFLPRLNNGEQRGVLIAQLRFGRDVLSFLATHFDHRSDDRERLESVDAIDRIATALDPSLMILAGDINARRDSEVLKRLQQTWTIAGDTEQPTIPAREPTRQIDFVLSRPALPHPGTPHPGKAHPALPHSASHWEVVDTTVIDEPLASDHRPLLAVLRWVTDPVRETFDRYDDILHHGDRSDPERSTTAAQWQSRRSSIVRAMQSVSGWLPTLANRPPPTYSVIEEVDCGSYVRQRITYRSQPGCDTPAYLCIPKNIAAGQSIPAILCLHPTDNVVGHDVVVGLGGKENRQYASELAERGYVTLAPSYPLLANYQPDIGALGWESGTLKAIWDNIRGIDLLASLAQVDADAIGAIGHSLGGHNSIFTAVFDDRIKAVVTSCGFDSFADYYEGNPEVWKPGKGWTQLRYMPRMADYQGRLNEIPFDFDELLAALAPRPVLVIAPLHDSNFRSDSVDRMVDRARQVYQLHDSPDQLQVLHPDCEHDFPDPMRERAYQLFDRTLRHQ